MKRLALIALCLTGCAGRYMLITASSALDCPQSELKHREDNDTHHVTGCGRAVKCSRVWWSGPDEWTCEVEK